MTDLDDDLDGDLQNEREIETASGDRIPAEYISKKASNTVSEGPNSYSGPSIRERLEQLREQRALSRSIFDELYGPENGFD